MNTPVPSVAANLNDIQVQQLSGFRVQESWGRWTLGQTSTVQVQAREGGWVSGDFDLMLPYAQQNLKIILNGEPVTQITSPRKYTSLSFHLPLNMRPGKNELRLVTDKSNLDPRLKPFAPQDLSDMAVSLNGLAFSPLQVSSADHPGQLYGVLKTDSSTIYRPFSGQQVAVFTRLPGTQTLKYRLLSAADGQTFTFRQDGRPVHRVTAGPRGTLVSGEVTLTLDGQAHRLDVTASAGRPPAAPPRDSLRSLERNIGTSSFYVQELSVHPQAPWQAWTQPLAGLAAALGLLLVFVLLFRRRRGNGRTLPADHQ